MKSNKTWVIIANGSQAKIYYSNDRKHHIELIKEISSESAHLLSSELGRDKPGRVFESANSAKHSVEPKHDLHQLEKLKFIAQLASLINKSANSQEFQELVLICSQEVLGYIRVELSKLAHSMVTKEINKDLTHINVKEILSYIT